jgi:DNA-binding NtrC family response regulator
MRKRRAIIFDDDLSLLKFFEELFLLRGYEVLTFAIPVICPIHAQNASASTALNPCADILITDYSMPPHMNGLDLLEAQGLHGCKLQTKNKAVMSGFIQPEVEGRIRHLGYAFFDKPMDLTKLETWIAGCENRADLSLPLAAPRKEERQFYSQDLPVVVRMGDRLMNVIAVNSSRSGLCLKFTMPIFREQKIRIQADLSPVSSIAAVRWVNKLDDGSYVAGLNFC